MPARRFLPDLATLDGLWSGRVGFRRDALMAWVSPRVSAALCATLACGPLAAAPALLVHPVTERQRLSVWLQHASDSVVRPAGSLQWWSQSREAEQVARRDALLTALGPSWSPLASRVRQMPVTGRVPLPSLDARFLEGRPALDPWLSPGDRLVTWQGPAVVALLQPTGHVCRVPHDERASLSGYLAACGVSGVDRAWVVQADGVVDAVDLRPAQRAAGALAVSPGAWLWAPTNSEAPVPEVSAQLAAFLATQPPASPDEPWAMPRPLAPEALSRSAVRPMPALSNDWGGIGLLQMPSARMGEVGTGALTLSSALPYTEIKARLQPFDWLSVDFGYLSLSGRRYGSQEVAGDQSYKDKTADVKVRLWEEGRWARWTPEVAVGWRDVLGTGLFASEYLVATKAWGDVDLTAGVAFGYLGSRAHFSNPLGRLADRFKQRQTDFGGKGGTFNVGNFFTGPMSVFGGVQWALPYEGWWLKAEYDSIDYERVDTGGRSVPQTSPINVALVHRPWSWLDVSLGVERGQRVALTVAMHTNLASSRVPKALNPPPPAVAVQAPAVAAPMPALAQSVEEHTGGRVSLVQRRGERLSLRLHDPVGNGQRRAIDRVVALVHAQQPEVVRDIDVTVVQEGVPVVSARVNRAQWVQARTEWNPAPTEVGVSVARVEDLAAPRDDEVQRRAPDDRTASSEDEQIDVSWQAPEPSAWKQGFGVFYSQSLGGPDGFWLFQTGLDWSAEFRLQPNTWLSGTVRLRVLDNYDKFKYTAPSNLPRVRTYVREYLTTRRVTVPNLQITHARALGDDVFAMGYAGLLETMYAGVGGELLYRPVDSRLALGVDVNEVQQRAFTQGLSLRDYRVTTGHLTAYWDTGWQDLLLKLSVGRYLAGDAGATVDVSRMFDNGVSMGAYATKTNVSAEQFGEGSFDKGIYVRIPFDVMLPRSSSSSATVMYAPLIRGGGARLQRKYTLYDLTRARDARLWSTSLMDD